SLKITQVTGSYTVASAFDGTADTYYSSSGDSYPFTINKEDAAIEYSGDVFKHTPANTTTSLNLSSVIREAGAAGYSGLPATNESPASLGNQLPGRELVFNLYTFNGTTPYKTCSATITAGATAGTGNATCTVTGVAIDDNPYRVDVSLTANGYYMAPIERVAVVVHTSVSGFVSGGGWRTAF